MRAADSEEQAHHQRQDQRSAADHQQDRHSGDDADAYQGIFAEADVFSGLLEPRAQQRRIRDQGRGIAFKPAAALGEQLADLGLGVARQNVAVALPDELHAPLEIFARGRTPHSQIGEDEGADTADHE